MQPLSAVHGTTVHLNFSVNDPDGAATNGSAPACAVRECGAAAGASPVLTPAPVLLTSGYPPGSYEVAIDTTTLDPAKTYAVYVSVDVGSVVPGGMIGQIRLTLAATRLVVDNSGQATPAIDVKGQAGLSIDTLAGLGDGVLVRSSGSAVHLNCDSDGAGCVTLTGSENTGYLVGGVLAAGAGNDGRGAMFVEAKGANPALAVLRSAGASGAIKISHASGSAIEYDLPAETTIDAGSHSYSAKALEKCLDYVQPEAAGPPTAASSQAEIIKWACFTLATNRLHQTDTNPGTNTVYQADGTTPQATATVNKNPDGSIERQAYQ